MLSRGFAFLLRGTKSRIIAPSSRTASSFNRVSSFRPYVGRRSMSNQVSSDTGSHVPSMHHVSSVDKLCLILTKTMKPPIPTEVPMATMERANSRRRIGINLIMGTVFLVGAIWIIKVSQKNREEHTLVSLHEKNVQRYEKVKQQEALAAEAASGKESS